MPVLDALDAAVAASEFWSYSDVKLQISPSKHYDDVNFGKKISFEDAPLEIC